MNILVTGGAGYIGSVCVEGLCDAGHDVVVVDNLSEGHREAVDQRARLVVADLHDTAALTGAMRQQQTEAVIHFAAFALVGESMQNPGKYFSNNVGGGVNLLESMVAAGVPKIVFSSTCATYGIPGTVPIDESTPQQPVNPYGESKFIFERILRWFGEIHGLQSVIFRYFNAAGASKRYGEDHRVETHLIPNVLRVALGQSEAVDVFGTDYDTPDGTAVRDYIHVQDLADIHRLAVERPVTGALNLGTGQGTSVRRIVEICSQVTGHPITMHPSPRRDGDPPSLVAANDRVKRTVGWSPKRTIQQAIEDAWNWHRSHPKGYGGGA